MQHCIWTVTAHVFIQLQSMLVLTVTVLNYAPNIMHMQFHMDTLCRCTSDSDRLVSSSLCYHNIMHGMEVVWSKSTFRGLLNCVLIEPSCSGTCTSSISSSIPADQTIAMRLLYNHNVNMTCFIHIQGDTFWV